MADPTSVLVAYATADGSTAGVAERVADVLRAAGAVVDCRPVGPDVDPAAFDALVVGSAVHNMAWLAPAIDLLRRVPDGVPLWCFSVGGVNPSGTLTRKVADLEGRRVAQQFPPGTVALDHRVFGGVIRMSGVPLWGRLFYRLTGGRAGDHRDWPAIERWATGIADSLLAFPVPRSGERP